MISKKKSTSIFLFSMLLLWQSIALRAQTGEENTITFKSPSKKFVDITLQSHNGLIRFGDLYYHRGVTPPTNTQAFNELVNMKYLTEAYADMDKTKISKKSYNGPTDKKTENSLIAQHQLKLLAGLVCTEETLKKYFCPDKGTQPCKFIDQYGERRHLGYWGDARDNEFAQLRSYTSFTKDNLEDLQSWSSTFFTNDTEIAYVVTRASVTGPYDFQKKGYWLGAKLGGRSQLINNLTFVPYNENERTLTQGRKVLVTVAPAQAKKLALQNRAPLFIVAKAKIYPNKKIPITGSRVPFAYELENQTLEIYKDIKLKEKIGEISVENLISKY
ncbi:hypothetical protein [Spongiimicrobium sp. 3-5]|uniref:hypothetical protein n=1 Tax=Spongiimicrobium sp. 3-5 TaxID=3332596 RepID=UPI00398039CA